MDLPLSVAIVCKNNEATIGRTLESVVGLAGEIVAVDSGSTDGTIALLEHHGARVIRSDWLGHVKTKQKALEACEREWVLALDSDESLEPKLCEAIKNELRRSGGPAFDAYRLNRRIWYRGRPLMHAWQPEWRVRLVRKNKAAWRGHDPHDELALTDRKAHVGDLGGPGGDSVLRHDSFETFTEHLRTQWAHSRTSARSLHDAGRRGSYSRLLISPPGAFFKQLVLKRSFRDGYAGWLAAATTAAGALMKHAMLIELSRQDRDAGSER